MRRCVDSVMLHPADQTTDVVPGNPAERRARYALPPGACSRQGSSLRGPIAVTHGLLRAQALALGRTALCAIDGRALSGWARQMGVRGFDGGRD